MPSQRVQTCSIGERSGDLFILEDIVGRVAQYVDEHYPVDKWHLGDLIAWVAQSALKYRPRICELSKCLEGPLKMIVCPKKLLPTLSHLVFDKCRIGIKRVRWSSSLRLKFQSLFYASFSV
ncbi:hypothetical protein TNCV_2849871 [Trichonephila clavipes]|nr:hypothetical protein TNCV_2849871 [Trichonephila clavipes]